MFRSKKSWRIPLGFLTAFWFLWVADPTPASFAIGAVLMTLGESIRFLSAGTLKKYKGFVVRDGIYGYTRNPLYIGSFLIGAGACIIGRSPLFTIVFLLTFTMLYSRVILREEKYLGEQYGDEYAKYVDEVPRYIPRGINIAEVFRESTVAQALNHKEYEALLGVLAVWAIMIVKMVWM